MGNDYSFFLTLDRISRPNSCVFQDLSRLNFGYARLHVRNCRKSFLRLFKRPHVMGGTFTITSVCRNKQRIYCESRTIFEEFAYSERQFERRKACDRPLMVKV